MIAGYLSSERFSPRSEGWTSYLSFSRLQQLRELVTMDYILCPRLLGLEDGTWPHLVEAALPEALARDLEWLIREFPASVDPTHQVLFVVVAPAEATRSPPDQGFELCGYELLERGGTISALTNCQGFPLAFDDAMINSVGLLSSFDDALTIRGCLKARYPEEPHADVEIFEVWRMTASEQRTRAGPVRKEKVMTSSGGGSRRGRPEPGRLVSDPAAPSVTTSSKPGRESRRGRMDWVQPSREWD